MTPTEVASPTDNAIFPGTASTTTEKHESSSIMSTLNLFVLSALVVGCQSAKASDPGTTAPAAPEVRAASEVVVSEGQSVDAEIVAEKAALEAAFQAQAFDEGWRATQEGRFRAEMAKFKNNSAILSLECRQTLCKLVFQEDPKHRKQGLFQLLASAVPEEDGFQGNITFRKYPDVDKTRSLVYVARNHYALPDKDGTVSELPKVGLVK